MRLSFTQQATEIFASLPRKVQVDATRVLDLTSVFPKMFPYRKRGVMAGLRCFTISRYRFFYRSANGEVMVVAIVPAVMKRS